MSDVLVNNAGISGVRISLSEATAEQMRAIGMDVDAWPYQSQRRVFREPSVAGLTA
jgi:hypothetical protein